jgi:hypothetical protein
MAPEPMAQVQHMPMGGDDSQATFKIMNGMRSTKPWLTLFAVLSFIGTAFIVLAALAAFGSSGMASGPFAGLGVGMGLGYLLMAGVYGYTGVLLWSYRSGIDGYLASGGDLESLAMTVGRQASFWRFVGVLTVIMMVLYALLLMAMLIGFANMR